MRTILVCMVLLVPIVYLVVIGFSVLHFVVKYW